jgi:hypothetical protein
MPELLDNYDFMDQRYVRKPEVLYTSAPTNAEGEDGEIRMVQDRNEYVMYVKTDGVWYLFRESRGMPSSCNMYADASPIVVTCTLLNVFYDVTPFEGAVRTGGFEWDTDVMIAPANGWYILEHHGAFNGTANVTYHISLYNGNTKIPNIAVERKIGTGNDIGAYAANGLVELKVGNKIGMKVAASTSGANFTMNHGGVIATLL